MTAVEQRSWALSRLSLFGTVIPVAMFTIGLAALVGGIVGLIHPWGVDNARVGFVWMALWGLFVLIALWFIVRRTASRVDSYTDGQIRIVTRGRDVTIVPGEAISLKRTPGDVWQYQPLLLRTTRGSFRICRQMVDFAGLIAALRAANPAMKVQRGWWLNPYRRDILD